MSWNTKITLSLGALIVAGSMFANTRLVGAHENVDTMHMAQHLSERFNLNATEVYTYLSENNLSNNFCVNDSTTAKHNHPEASTPHTHTIKASNQEGYLSNDQHIAFIDSKLATGVKDRWMTEAQRKAVIGKLRDMMKSTPTSAQYVSMSTSEQQNKISAWQADMRAWTRKNGLSLDQIKNITGKGNKYLMGIEY